MTTETGPVPAQPDTAAVEAAARALRDDYDTQYDASHVRWQEFADLAHRALDAAAPLIRDQALRDAATAVEARKMPVREIWTASDLVRNKALDEAAVIIRGLVEGDGDD